MKKKNKQTLRLEKLIKQIEKTKKELDPVSLRPGQQKFEVDAMLYLTCAQDKLEALLFIIEREEK